MEQKCIFCSIVAKQIPSFNVYEDENFIAFLDIRPLNKGHTLVIPKKHFQWTYDAGNFGPYWEIAKKVALAQINALDAKFVQFLTAGLGVPHAHIHVVPRYEDDGHGEYLNPANVKEMSQHELKETEEKLKSGFHEEKHEEPKEEVKEEIKKPEWNEDELEMVRRDVNRA